ncbi:MAG TPA: phage tail sheath subtilisin-like domain-containing protein [Pyrinomonadaceae bacterium]|jgi:Bacteriophage tail sheath protein|nr:phage tail sheath subtilisin-like domain-containing protein [Pyrinomonadaceae bacterium]
MTEPLSPGVHIEENETPITRIEGVDTQTALLIGVTTTGPEIATTVASFVDFVNAFGPQVPEPESAIRDRWTTDDEGGHWWQFSSSVKGFFDNGGQQAVIKRIPLNNPESLTPDDFVRAIESLSDLTDVGLSLAPGMWSEKIHAALIKMCEQRGDSFTILDPPPALDINGIRAFRSRRSSSYAALYYPWLSIDGIDIASSGHVAGIYARSDRERGIHKAPANEEIRGISKLAREVSNADQALLNQHGINALRSFPGHGSRVWGARTLSPDPDFKYVNVRRLLVYLERSIDVGTQWVQFEPNNERTWANVRLAVSDFLHDAWRDGALMGVTPENAFFVKCDRSTMTQNDLDNGRLICLIGVAVMKPAEFVLFRIGQWTAESNA